MLGLGLGLATPHPNPNPNPHPNPTPTPTPHQVLAPPMQLLLQSDRHRVRVGEGMRLLRALIAESSNAR